MWSLVGGPPPTLQSAAAQLAAVHRRAGHPCEGGGSPRPRRCSVGGRAGKERSATDGEGRHGRGGGEGRECPVSGVPAGGRRCPPPTHPPTHPRGAQTVNTRNFATADEPPPAPPSPTLVFPITHLQPSIACRHRPSPPSPPLGLVHPPPHNTPSASVSTTPPSSSPPPPPVSRRPGRRRPRADAVDRLHVARRRQR